MGRSGNRDPEAGTQGDIGRDADGAFGHQGEAGRRDEPSQAPPARNGLDRFDIAASFHQRSLRDGPLNQYVK